MMTRSLMISKGTNQDVLVQDKGEFGSVSGKIEVDLKINHEGEVCLYISSISSPQKYG